MTNEQIIEILKKLIDVLAITPKATSDQIYANQCESTQRLMRPELWEHRPTEWAQHYAKSRAQAAERSLNDDQRGRAYESLKKARKESSPPLSGSTSLSNEKRAKLIAMLEGKIKKPKKKIKKTKKPNVKKKAAGKLGKELRR